MTEHEHDDDIEAVLGLPAGTFKRWEEQARDD